MDYNITMLDDLPDIDEIETGKSLMQTKNSMIPDNMYNKFKGNLRPVRQIPNEAGMNTAMYIGNYTPVNAFPQMSAAMTPITTQQITLPLHTAHTTQYTQNQIPSYYVQQPSQVHQQMPILTESYVNMNKINDRAHAEITMSTENFENKKCDCTNTLKGYLVAIIILLIIFILLLMYFIRVINNLTRR